MCLYIKVLRAAFKAALPLLLCSVLPLSFASATEVTSLRDVLSRAIQTNPDYGQAHSRFDARKQTLRQSQALFLPSVDLNADYGWERSDDIGTRARGGTQNLTRNDIGITLTQMLMDGGAAHYSTKEQKFELKSSTQRLEETTQLVGLSVIEAYLDVLHRGFLLRLAEKNILQHEQILNKVRTGAKGGSLTQADQDQAIARLSFAKANAANAKESLKTALANYKAETGFRAERLTRPVPPKHKISKTLYAEINQAINHSPTLEAFNESIKAREARTQALKAERYPKFNLQMNARSGKDLAGIEGSDKSASALVVMNWNLYRGGGDLARERESFYQYQEAKHAKEKTQRAIENDVRQTWASLNAARERRAFYETQAVANESVVEAYKDQFQINRRSLLDVLDVQNEYISSQSNAITAWTLEALAIYRLLALKGDLLSALDLTPPTIQKDQM